MVILRSAVDLPNHFFSKWYKKIIVPIVKIMLDNLNEKLLIPKTLLLAHCNMLCSGYSGSFKNELKNNDLAALAISDWLKPGGNEPSLQPKKYIPNKPMAVYAAK